MRQSDPENPNTPRYCPGALSYTDAEILQCALKLYMTRMEDNARKEVVVSRNDVLGVLGLAPEGENPSVDLRYTYAAQFAGAKGLFDRLTTAVGYDTTEV